MAVNVKYLLVFSLSLSLSLSLQTISGSRLQFQCSLPLADYDNSKELTSHVSPDNPILAFTGSGIHDILSYLEGLFSDSLEQDDHDHVLRSLLYVLTGSSVHTVKVVVPENVQKHNTKL